MTCRNCGEIAVVEIVDEGGPLCGHWCHRCIVAALAVDLASVLPPGEAFRNMNEYRNHAIGLLGLVSDKALKAQVGELISAFNRMRGIR